MQKLSHICAMRIQLLTVVMMLGWTGAIGAAQTPAPAATGAATVKTESWDYTAAAKETLKKFKGTAGVVLHMGDSITIDIAYGQWPLKSSNHSAEETAILQWMHCGAKDKTDGWTLATTQIGWRVSATAASGVKADEFLKGGKNAKDGKPGLATLDDMIKTYNPQMVVLMLGTNDAWNGRTADAFIADMTTIIDKLAANGTVVILSSIPPHTHAPKLAEEYNARLFELAKTKKLPFLDFYGEILKRQPGTAWDGTILGKGDVHPTDHGPNGITTVSAPTEENLKNCGYLLRAWLTVQKIKEVKTKVIGN
ncbi:MAG TPA: SGNH/GDSL hydrolase family protein [Planctomycetota bacterium]|nr:SGNH/GDSL hydrolase family protein [Planctomycetota bacterium]